MQTLKIVTISAALLLGATGLAVAQTNHGHSAQQSGAATGTSNGPSGPMPGERAEMMQKMMPMMMKMHAQMLDGSMGMMGNGGGPGMAMMDREMMQIMRGPGMMGMLSAEDSTAIMQLRLMEYDADEDGSLSLSEFEALHAAMIRETTVDRFQHMDADGDGKISSSEMTAPAGRMKMGSGMDGMPMGDTAN